MPSLPASIRRRLRAIRILQPLAERDYALLTGGSLISQLGDGFFYVAQAWTLPLLLFVLIGGVFSDRYDRRWLMVGADLVEPVA